jgi:hypothetical protein
MLVLTRRIGETLIHGHDIRVTVLDVSNGMDSSSPYSASRCQTGSANNQSLERRSPR